MRKDKLDDAEAVKKIAASWFSTHGGENSGGTAILDEEMTFQEIAHKLADSECQSALNGAPLSASKRDPSGDVVSRPVAA